METFIDLVIEQVWKKHADDYSNLCIVFPTRRAGLIFRKKFASKLSKPVWSPSVMAIGDFISALSPLRVAEDPELVFELFEVFKRFNPPSSFDNFFHWGKMLLNDFNEIDLQLINADQIFKNITELKNIESEFGLAGEDAERIASFWKNFSDQELSKLKTAFKNNWKFLPAMYHAFRELLLQKGMCYEGMASRLVSEQLQKDEQHVKWEQFIFAGFYALSRSHEQIIEHLKKRKKVKQYWDTDAYYLDDAMQEAGNYFRKKKLADHNFLWKKNYFGETEKNLWMTGVPLHVGQAKYLGNVISEQIAGKSFSDDKTAIVLPDENLLFPVLYSLPDTLSSFNVTMGYPLKKSLVSGLLYFLYALQKHAHDKENSGIYFYSHDAINLMEHPYIINADEKFVHEKTDEIKRKNKIYCSLKEFSDSEIAGEIKLIFRKVNTPVEVFEYVIELLKACAGDGPEKKHLHKLEQEIILFVIHELKALLEIIRPYSKDIETEMAWQLIRKTVEVLKIPFSGEPVQGLQIMGFLETRVLDFENLFILSVNESILPASSLGNSYIPYALRKSFGLPTYEEQEAVYAYHFYRMLQRAKNVHLIYNTEVKSLSGGEKSRYLLQLSHELKKNFSNNIHLHHSICGTEISSVEVQPVSIKKTHEVMEILNQQFTIAGAEKNGFSASALSSYINCPLQFYFRYIARIKESETLEESIESDTFGKILHGTMQRLYADHKLLTDDKINALYSDIEMKVSESFSAEMHGAYYELEGENYLLHKVMLDLVHKILDADKAIVPFTIETLEAKFTQTLSYNDLKPEVVLQGVFDRVDQTNGFVRIIDYKSGSAELSSKNTFEEIFSNPKHKATFQLYYYSCIYKRQHPHKKILAGIYRMKSISEGISYLNSGKEITEAVLNEFEKHLKNLIAEIMDPAKIFSQTEDVKRCIFCPYKEICSR